MDNKVYYAAGAVGLLGLYFLVSGSKGASKPLPPGSTTTGGYTNTSNVTQYVTAAGNIANAAGQIINTFKPQGGNGGGSANDGTGPGNYGGSLDANGLSINSAGYLVDQDNNVITDDTGEPILGAGVSG